MLSASKIVSNFRHSCRVCIYVCNIYLQSVFKVIFWFASLKRKQPFLFSSTTGWVKENESFLLVEPCFRVIRCMETKLQFSFRKYVSICTVYTVLIWLILTTCIQLMVAATLGKTYDLRNQNVAMVSDSFPTGKPRAVDNINCLFRDWHIECSTCACRAINQ